MGIPSSLFALSLKSSFLKSDREQFALITLYKKERLWANPTRCSLQNSDFGQIALVTLKKRAMQANCSLSLSKNERFDQKKFFIMFLTVISLFFPLLSPRANCPCCSSLWCSLQKSVCEQIAPITLYKRSSVSNSLFSKSESLFCSFAHKKRAIRLKNQRADSQPCFLLTITT